MIRRVLIPAACALILTPAHDAFAGLLSLDTVTRTYTGTARTSGAGNTVYEVPLSASATGAGSLSEQAVNSNHGGANAVARGLQGSAVLEDLGGEAYVLQVATGSQATHQAQAPVVYTPSYGLAAARVELSAVLDLSATVLGTPLAFTSQWTTSGTGNTGTLTITSDLDDLLFSSAIASLPSAWAVTPSAGAVVRLDLMLNSSSFRDVGTNLYTVYSDTDTQGLSLGIDAGAARVPLPATPVLLGVGALALGRRRRRR